MRKFKIFWDFDEEEKYLNKMAAQGHILKKYSAFGVYHFKEEAPQQLNYKVDYKTFKSKGDFEDYVSLFEDAGWKHISGTRCNGSQYFLPQNNQPDADIFSDQISAAARYKSLAQLCLVDFTVFIAYLVTVFLGAGADIRQLGFLTPGLWERTGAAFWSGFFFELPFVILRVGFPIFFLVVACFLGYWAYKAKAAYNRKMKEGVQQ